MRVHLGARTLEPVLEERDECVIDVGLASLELRELGSGSVEQVVVCLLLIQASAT